MPEEITRVASPQSSNRIGKYQLLAKIATGGMAEIFIARVEGPAGFEKLIVIKRILPHLAEDKHFVEMFLDEARIAAHLDHPNIVQIYDLGDADGNYYIAMEYLSGGSFADLILESIENRRRIDAYFCCALIAQVCEGLHFAHFAKLPDGTPMGIVHRDINPRNLVITFSGSVKVVDFGVAKALGRITRTVAGGVKGTYPYMSPEQARGAAIDLRSDLFSLGTVFWELLAQRRLFKRPTDLATLMAITQEELPRLREIRPDLDPALEEIVGRALTRDRDQRYQTARAMQQDLHNAMDHARARVSMPEIADYMEKHLIRVKERHRYILERAKSPEADLGPVSIVSHDTEADVPDASSEVLDLQSISESRTDFSVLRGPLPEAAPPKPKPKGTFGWVLGALVLGILAVVVFAWVKSGPDPQPKPIDPKLPDKPVIENLVVPPPADAGVIEAKPQTTIEIVDAPPRSLVKVDAVVRGEILAGVSFRLEVAPDVEHRIRLEKAGFLPREESIKLAAGESRKLSFPLIKPKLEYGTLEVNCVPWCRIWIDGKDTGLNSPAKAIRLTAGRHTLRVVNPPTGRTKEQSVVVKKDANTREVIRLP